jgi:CheY-like chemotaxis protein
LLLRCAYAHLSYRSSRHRTGALTSLAHNQQWHERWSPFFRKHFLLQRILVVEDNAMVRDSFVELLTKRGYAVTDAEDGERGIHLARRSGCDLAIIDVMMPTMGGLEFRQELLRVAPQTMVLFVTGQPDKFEQLVEDDSEFIGGKFTVLYKPVHPVKLLAEVERLIGAPAATN